jgi:cytochrome P450
MDVDTEPIAFPIPRESECPFDPVPEYTRLREQGRPVRVTCPSGITAWLVTRYDHTREVLGSPERFSTRPGSLSHVLASLRPDAPMVEGNFTCMDGQDHRRFKRPLGSELWSVDRINALRPMVQRIVDDHLDALAAAGTTADWYGAFAMPVTTQVLSEVIGVPYEDRALAHRVGATLSVFGTPEEELPESLTALVAYLLDLVRKRRAHPEDDLLSRLMHEHGEGAGYSDLEVAMVAVSLLIAGHDSAASAIAYTTLSLLDEPGNLGRLAEQPELLPNAVDELVRYLVNGLGFSRITMRDTEIGGQPIAAGEYIVLAMQTANRDPDLYPDADVLDIARKPGAHLGFGHGPHKCLGQQIARLMLSVIVETVIRRVPSMRLACPMEKVEYKADGVVRGPATLPVMWDAVLPRGK